MERTARRKSRMIVAACAAGLALTGCGEATATPSTDHRGDLYKSNVEAVYDSTNGTRILLFSNMGKYAAILEFCDGPDLVEQTQWSTGGSGNDIERSPNHPACDDGKLTPEDFASDAAAPTPTPSQTPGATPS